MIPRTSDDRMTALVVGALVLAALALVFILPSGALLAGRDTDMASEFVSWRAFLADSLRHGHIPLWNPYTYGGQPFLGGFESAVLYPPNLLFVVLPLAPALNFSILLHLILLGFGMERWARNRGLQPWAAGLAGVVVPLSGSVFPHIFAGHLSNLCTMAWTPWIFLGLESWTRQRDRRGLFLASAAICLQILAGHVQYFFYTAVAAGAQALIVTIAEPASRRRAIPAVIGCYLAGALLGAAQLFPGLAAAHEGIRQTNLDYAFASMFGFPPENFLTVIAPGFFGTLVEPRLYNDPDQSVYWGRCYLWEMSLFIGTVAPLLIAIAAGVKNGARRQVVIDLLTAGFLLILALGVHTPAFDFFYYLVPGFGHFRAWSKFIFPATLLLVLVMATGADALLRGKTPPRAIAWCGIFAGGFALLGGAVLLFSPELLGGFFQFILASRESYLSSDFFNRPDTLHTAGLHAGLSLALAGLVLLVAGTCLLFQKKHPVLRFALPVILFVEMIGYAAGLVPLAHPSDVMPDSFRQFVAAHPGDYRVLDLIRPDNGFLLGAGDIGGNNPSVLRRYAEFMTYTQGGDPDHATQNIPFHTLDPLYAMLRLRYVFEPTETASRIAESPTPPLPRLSLLPDWKLETSRDAIFSAMRDPAFVPGKTALLESQPEPAPTPGATGTARLISEQPDELVIEADTDKPALLLITDLYARDWRAEPLPGSVQTSYQLQPADYILRAIPLAAGHHHLRIVYAPTAFPLGVTLSAAGWLAWLVLFLRYRRKAASTQTSSKR